MVAARPQLGLHHAPFDRLAQRRLLPAVDSLGGTRAFDDHASSRVPPSGWAARHLECFFVEADGHVAGFVQYHTRKAEPEVPFGAAPFRPNLAALYRCSVRGMGSRL